MVRRSGEPGPAPTRVMRPPLVGWILGGFLVVDFLVRAELIPANDDDDCICCCWSWINLSFL